MKVIIFIINSITVTQVTTFVMATVNTVHLRSLYCQPSFRYTLKFIPVLVVLASKIKVMICVFFSEIKSFSGIA